VAKSHELQRRDFVKSVVAVIGTIIGGFITLPTIGYLISPALKVSTAEAWIPLGPLENYPVDTPTLFNFTRTKINGWEKTVNSYGVYVVNQGDGQAKVYNNMCTHLSCRVTWQPDNQIYFCPCHDGQFDPDGEVVGGPPPRPLNIYETKVEEGVLSIHFIEG